MLNFSNQNFNSMYSNQGSMYPMQTMMPMTQNSMYPMQSMMPMSQGSMYPMQNNMYSNQNNMYSNQNIYSNQNNMYSSQNNTYNNMYTTQNYCQPTNNITNIINNYYQVVQPQQQVCYAPVNTAQQNCFQTANYGNQYMMNQFQPMNTMMSCNNYAYPQQNSFNLNSMFTTLLSTLFGSMANQQPAQQIIPTFNYNNSSQSSLIDMFKQLLGVQTTVQEPTIEENMSTLYDIISEFWDSTDDTVEEYQDDVEVSSGSSGDPHFAAGGKQSFDFQGVDQGIYSMIDNKDIALNAKFTGNADIAGARVINSQNLEIKSKDVNIVSHPGGKFEIFKDGEKIADETNYKTDEKALKVLKDDGIEVTYEGTKLLVKYGNRTIAQQLNGGNVDNIDSVLMNGDEGILTQTIGALDDDKDGKTKWTTDINKDGKVDDKDVAKYDLKNQIMVHTEAAASSSKAITAEIEAAIKADVEAGEKLGSVVKGYSTEHGYDARQWNEYLGMKLFTTTDELLKT